MNAGYIKLYRKIREHWIWDEPQHLKWWLDILLMANHKPQKIRIGNEFKTISTGMFHTSELKLSERWFADRKTVDKFLKLLEKDEMLSINKSRQYGTTLKVNNYQALQGFSGSVKDNETDNQVDIKTPSKPHKQEPNNEKNNISLADCRQRYTDLQLKVIDKYFEILKHTRKSCALAESIYLKSYQDWEKHEQAKVIHALEKYINNPALHDKKENYVLGIINNTTMAEVEKSKTKTENPTQGNPWLKLKT